MTPYQEWLVSICILCCCIVDTLTAVRLRHLRRRVVELEGLIVRLQHDVWGY